jgi:hypothetical protein
MTQALATTPQSEAPAAAAPKKRLTLSAVTKGKLWNPLRVVIHGPDGIGKTAFSVGARGPLYNKGSDDSIVLPTESGAEYIDVARFPLAETLEDVNAAIDELLNEGHQYRKLVVDSLDWLEGLARDYVCRKHSKKNIEDFGFGKGQSLVFDEMRALVLKLERLRAAKGMHIIGTAHTVVKNFKNPEGDNFDRYELKLQSSNNANIAGLWREWPEFVLFTNFEVLTNKEKDGQVKGISTGERFIFTQRTAAYDAKSRIAIAPRLPLEWGGFARAVKEAFDNKGE